MKLTLNRQASFAGATMGRLYIEDSFVCFTLEDELREIEGQPVSTWKIKGNTAIPHGIYNVVLEYSGRFGADTLTVLDVPGFKYIRMHAGNTAVDTEGCILLGMRATDRTLIGGTSRPAVQLAKNEVRSALQRNESVVISINNPTSLA